MVDSDNSNQKNYKSNQDYQIDITKVYATFIKPIDEMRSKINVTSPQNKGLINKKMKDTNDRTNSIRSLLKPEIDYQESRCHAFYRLIGFPIYDGTDFYNPGYDKHFGESKKIKQSKKEEIRTNPIEAFVTLSDKREIFAQDFLTLFSNNSTIDASVVALSSSTNVRKFAVAIENVNNVLTDLNPEIQSYKLSLDGRVGKSTPKLTDYINANGVAPTSKLQEKRYHIITPFLTDARYDITVPTKQMVAVPFADVTKLRSTEVDSVKRPWIDKVIEDRLNVSTDTIPGSTSLQNMKDYIQGVDSLKNEELILSVLNNNFTLTDQQQFIRFIDIIRSMMLELIKAQEIIEEVQKEYYWLPIPSKTGPEGGSSVRELLVSKEIANKKVLTTKLDFDMTVALFNKMVADANKKYSPENKAEESGSSFIFSSNDFVPAAFNAQNPDPQNNISTKTFDDMNKTRNRKMKNASEALRIVEIIMGEFSGLGLCDIIAVIASLYLIPIESLVSFLDDDAFDRMKSSLRMPSDFNIEREPLESCMYVLSETVKQFYILMDNVYKNMRFKNKRS